MKIPDILKPIAADMRAVDTLIRTRLASDIALINSLSEHLIGSGGKRLRPALVLLTARALNYKGSHHYQLAAVIEFIHTATLLHDDVVDHSDLRRGEPTANALWGNEASVLTGDFLYSRAFQLMVELDEMPILRVLADTTNQIAEGEVLQLLNCHNPDVNEASYNQVIERKTAVLFAAASRSAALLAGADTQTEEALAQFGLHLGTAFQLIDDCLDYSADPAATGKQLGDDLAEGKTTLPVIHALQHSDTATQQRLRQAIRTGGRDAIDDVLRAIDATGAIAYTARRARAEADAAMVQLESIPDTPYRQILATLAQFAAQRDF